MTERHDRIVRRVLARVLFGDAAAGHSSGEPGHSCRPCDTGNQRVHSDRGHRVNEQSRVAVLLVVLASAAGLLVWVSASGGSGTAATATALESTSTVHDRAQALCASKLRRKVASALPATVGELRVGRGGGPPPPASSSTLPLFPTASKNDFGAWCRTRVSAGTYTTWAVTAAGQPVLVEFGIASAMAPVDAPAPP